MTDEKLQELCREMSGELRDEDRFARCPICEGMGYIDGTGEKCHDCDGEGWEEI